MGRRDLQSGRLVKPARVGYPVGAIVFHAVDEEPTGWLRCSGQAVSESTYAALFGVIGYTYGNPGGGNFNLPDLRGRVPIGLDNMGGSSADRITDANADSLGGAGGSEVHALTAAQNGPHAHTQKGGAKATGSTHATRSTVTTGGLTACVTANQGSGTGHNTLQPFVTVNYLIKT